METNPTPLPTLANRLAALRQAVAAANLLHSPGKPPVTLVGASKTQPAAVLAEAIALGLRHFGENKVQEAQAKWPALKAAHPEVVLHLIGPLQSNKAGEAVALFDVIETVDRPKIATALANAVANHPSPAARRFYIQVNTGEEPQKAGVLPRDLEKLVALCRTLETEHWRLDGLMCIPPAHENPAPHFALLDKLASRYGLSARSMGMSDDFAAAIRLGATHVRIGTRLFGERR